ncbi:MAG: hypothetical protein J0L92_40755 [Deltaproteobacteria bacterium]|nr:hypothetical protein [Deltaproteobacteria bacterium]
MAQMGPPFALTRAKPLRPLACIVAALVLVLSATARAQAVDPATTAAARSLFEHGVAAADAGEHAAAAELLGRSLALRPSPVVAYNRAQSLAQLGRLVEASEMLVLAEQLASSDALHEAASALHAQLEARVSRLTVVTSEETDLVVQLDGRPLGSALLGTEMPIDAGPHVVSALRDGEVIASVERRIEEGESAVLTLVVPPRAQPVALVATPGPQRTSGDGSIDLPLVIALTTVGALAVAGLAIGLGVGLSSAPSPVVGNLSPGVVRFGP